MSVSKHLGGGYSGGGGGYYCKQTVAQHTHIRQLSHLFSTVFLVPSAKWRRRRRLSKRVIQTQFRLGFSARSVTSRPLLSTSPFSSQYYSGWFSGAETGASNSDHGYLVLELVTDLPSLRSIMQFTSCGKQGRNGPGEADCDAYYQDTDPDNWYRSVTNGIQRLIVPKTGMYRLTLGGAKGGDAAGGQTETRPGGYGATASATFLLEKDEVLNLVVGQHGQYRTSFSASTYGGGGGGEWAWPCRWRGGNVGTCSSVTSASQRVRSFRLSLGGTFVWKEAECHASPQACLPLLVAGGGGGASYTSGEYHGGDGRAEHAGGNAIGHGGDGGNDGQGGYSSSSTQSVEAGKDYFLFEFTIRILSPRCAGPAAAAAGSQKPTATLPRIAAATAGQLTLSAVRVAVPTTPTAALAVVARPLRMVCG